MRVRGPAKVIAEEAVVLDEAAKLLERDGWVQGRGRDERGGRCVITAMSDVSIVNGVLCSLADAAEAILVQLGWEPWDVDGEAEDQLTVVNDTPGMTAERMIGAMRTAAQRLVAEAGLVEGQS